MMFFNNIFQFSKKKYILGKRPEVDCILCETLRDKSQVPSLTVVESENVVVAINLYPYNTGHLMIFPKRHVQDIRDLNTEEDSEIISLTKYFITILEQAYSPTGFNIGYNQGEFSGASIKHIHQHIIPRFSNEVGVVDLVGGAKVIIEDPNETMEDLRGRALSGMGQIDLEIW
ncbi:MAG: HIT domain-containing protein [Bacteriovoracaceae bacterium]|nr:HIT domain-containing protein [Bacteriovoracaceae bacterium]